MQDAMSLPIVPIHLDGANVFVAFELDPREHDRRAACRVRALTSTPVLHGLWLLPEGIPVPADSVPPVKRRRLREARHFVTEGAFGFERLYSPPGTVRGVGFTGEETMRAIRRAARLTPIVQRVVVTSGEVPKSSRAWCAAQQLGIGLVEVTDGRARVMLDPRPPVRGVPAVYRWWIAELAYESWLNRAPTPSAAPSDPAVP